nr:hypothetical protein GCM10020185_31990 [Pseudomonas brassicacearum subsp. brassicacearum]
MNWDEPDVRPSWYHNMSSVLQAGPCVRTNQLDFDEEVVFKAQQYLFDHIREDGDQPFCLTVSMTHPHDPYTIPKAFWDLYDDNDIPLPQTPAQKALDPHSQRLLKVYDLWDKPLPVDKIRDARRAYFGACSYIDCNVGKLLQTLEDTGLLDDTIIVFSGDHGDMLGEKGLWYKNALVRNGCPRTVADQCAGAVRQRPGERGRVHRRFAANLGGAGRRHAGTGLAAGWPFAGAASARAGRA